MSKKIPYLNVFSFTYFFLCAILCSTKRQRPAAFHRDTKTPAVILGSGEFLFLHKAVVKVPRKERRAMTDHSPILPSTGHL